MLTREVAISGFQSEQSGEQITGFTTVGCEGATPACFLVSNNMPAHRAEELLVCLGLIYMTRYWIGSLRFKTRCSEKVGI